MLPLPSITCCCLSHWGSGELAEGGTEQGQVARSREAGSYFSLRAHGDHVMRD